MKFNQKVHLKKIGYQNMHFCISIKTVVVGRSSIETII